MDRLVATNATNPGTAFDRGRIAGTERVLCLNEADGKILWQHEYDCPYTVSYASGPRVTPCVSDGKVYTLGAEGDLFCLDTATGKVIWSRDFKRDFSIATPMWGFAGNPLIDGHQLICLAGGSNSVAVAFDKNTGQELWRALSAKEPGYSSPVIYTFGGQRQLIIWHPESVNALDPETGRVFWSTPFSSRFGLTAPTPRQVEDRLFVTAFYDGSLMLRITNAESPPEVLWKSRKASEKDTDMLHSIIPTPFIEGGHIYGVCSYGQLRCLKVADGERVWETLAATTKDNKETRWGNAFLIKNGERFFLFNELGDLIIARLTPQGYDEISRAHLIEPANRDPGRPVVWSHPAFANRSCYVRNDREIVCVSLAGER
jgi:outer membrane protein assembly factor BamB